LWEFVVPFRFKKLLSPIGLVASLAIATAKIAAAYPGPLDGKSLAGAFAEMGKRTGDPDKLTFANGRFRSAACDPYGFSDAPYTAIIDRDVIRFEAQTTSTRYGTLKWSGVVHGQQLESTANWLQSGKAPTQYIVDGTLKP
jgi:hypothetical protein